MECIHDRISCSCQNDVFRENLIGWKNTPKDSLTGKNSDKRLCLPHDCNFVTCVYVYAYMWVCMWVYLSVCVCVCVLALIFWLSQRWDYVSFTCSVQSTTTWQKSSVSLGQTSLLPVIKSAKTRSCCWWNRNKRTPNYKKGSETIYLLSISQG